MAKVQEDLRTWNQGKRAELPGLRWGGVEVASCLSWTDSDGVLHEVKPSNLQHIKDLPTPVQHLSCGKLWLADEIEAFARVYQERQRARAARRAAA